MGNFSALSKTEIPWHFSIFGPSHQVKLFPPLHVVRCDNFPNTSLPLSCPECSARESSQKHLVRYEVSCLRTDCQGCIPSFHWSAGQVSVRAILIFLSILAHSPFYQRNVTCWSLEKIQKRKKLTDLDDKHRVQIHSFFRHIWIFSGSSFYLHRPECGLRPYSSTWEIFQLWAKLRFHDTFQFSAQATKSSCSYHCTLFCCDDIPSTSLPLSCPECPTRGFS